MTGLGLARVTAFLCLLLQVPFFTILDKEAQSLITVSPLQVAAFSLTTKEALSSDVLEYILLPGVGFNQWLQCYQTEGDILSCLNFSNIARPEVIKEESLKMGFTDEGVQLITMGSMMACCSAITGLFMVTKIGAFAIGMIGWAVYGKSTNAFFSPGFFIFLACALYSAQKSYANTMQVNKARKQRREKKDK